MEYIKNNWGEKVSNLSNEELQVEVSTMVMHRKACTRMAVDDLSNYTSAMAKILDVKQHTHGYESPVMDRNEWIQSLMENPSELQIQKWIFAWMFVRANYTKFAQGFKLPEELFEDTFMRINNLQYDSDQLNKMKKNTKTCI